MVFSFPPEERVPFSQPRKDDGARVVTAPGRMDGKTQQSKRKNRRQGKKKRNNNQKGIRNLNVFIKIWAVPDFVEEPVALTCIAPRVIVVDPFIHVVHSCCCAGGYGSDGSDSINCKAKKGICRGRWVSCGIRCAKVNEFFYQTIRIDVGQICCFIVLGAHLGVVCSLLFLLLEASKSEPFLHGLSSLF